MIVVLLATGVLAFYAPPIPGAQATPGYGPLQRDWRSAVAYSIAHPDILPVGMNDESCRLDERRPRPLVLLNGAFLNKYATWSMYSAELAAAGYCVYGLDYGGPEEGPFHQMGDLRSSAREIGAFIEQILAQTGADQVDLLGYSEGGIVPFYYLNELGGTKRVHTLVSLAAPVHGMSGYRMLEWISEIPQASAFLGGVLPAAVDGTRNSEFIRTIHRGALTRPGVRYVSVYSRTDLVVEPREARLDAAPEVTNMVIQDHCAEDRVFHGSVIYDDITLRLVRNGLDPATARAPRCHPVLPIVE